MKLRYCRLLSLALFLMPYIVLAQDEEDPEGPPLPPDVALNGTTLLLVSAVLFALFYFRKQVPLNTLKKKR